jgi:hypothetical protein
MRAEPFVESKGRWLIGIEVDHRHTNSPSTNSAISSLERLAGTETKGPRTIAAASGVCGGRGWRARRGGGRKHRFAKEPLEEHRGEEVGVGSDGLMLVR